MWVRRGKPPSDPGWYLCNIDGMGGLVWMYYHPRYNEWIDEEGYQKQPKWWWNNEKGQ